MKKVIVTGADGFIGSALEKIFAVNGNRVYTLLFDIIVVLCRRKAVVA